MQPVNFPQRNKIYTAPPEAEMLDIPVHFDEKHTITTSCWELSKEDIELIAKTGKLWLRVWGVVRHPVLLQAENPFSVPAPMDIDERIANRVFLTFYDDMEVVALYIDEGEHSFEVVEHEFKVLRSKPGQQFYHLQHKHNDYGDQVFDSHYIFGENLKVFGLASEHYGRFDELAERFVVPVNQLLILERINKTER